MKRLVMFVLAAFSAAACTSAPPAPPPAPALASPTTAAATGTAAPATATRPAATALATRPAATAAATRPAATAVPAATTRAPAVAAVPATPRPTQRLFLPDLPQRDAPQGTRPAATAPPAAATAVVGGPACEGLVTAADSRFVLDGQPWTFLGANISYLLSLPPAQAEQSFAFLAAHHVGVVRTWLVPGADLAYFERLLDVARRYNLRFIVALDDFYSFPKDTSWYGEGYRRDYLPHVRDVVTRFRGRPEVFMWQLMNEPNCGREGVSDECLRRLRSWARETAQVVRGLDACRPVAVGLIGIGGNLEREEQHFKTLAGLDGVDSMTLHRYAYEDFTEKLKRELALVEDKEMPLVWSEVYEKAYDKGCEPLSNDATSKRAALIRRDLERSFTAGVDGYVLWQFAWGTLDRDGRTENFCGETDYERSDPVWEVFKSFRLPTEAG